MTQPDEPFVVRTTGVTKTYGARAAVRDVSIGVRPGEVYGLLGPNGAGKTTTLRMLLGLVRPDAGEIEVLGAPPGDPAALERVGALVEEPALYPFLSGRGNLEVLARYKGLGHTRAGSRGEPARGADGRPVSGHGTPPAAAFGTGLPAGHIDAALDAVGLRERADDKVRGYSLGMRQRLGVAAALLGDPQVLILDEPTNGLDPQGMAAMRTLIRSLGRGNRTVIVSSHQLGEVEQICDRVAVMRAGELLVEDDVSNLRGAAELIIRGEPLDNARAIVEAYPGVESVQQVDGALHVTMSQHDPAGLNRALVTAGIAVSELRSAQQSLEDVFMSLTGTETVA